MILLDTNVISEPLRHAPEARVIDWIDAQPLETLYLSACRTPGRSGAITPREAPRRMA